VAHEDPVDALFGLPPEDFTAARDALAKRLRAEGHAEAARTVRQLRRPSVAAWAVDQLARAAPEDLQRLLDTGDDLRRSQRAALSGAGGGRLREATARRRALLAELTERAAGLLTDAGRSPDPHRAAIAGTLEAATVDDEAADLVRSGRLSRELPPPSGFGDLTGLTLVPDAPAADADADADAADDDAEAADAQIAEAADADPADAAPAAADSAGAASEEADGHRAAASRAGDPDTAVEPGAPRQAPETAREQKEARKRAAEQERERVARVAAEEEAAAARDRADVAEAAAAGAEEEATTARGRADAAVEAVRDLERRLSEARREREEAERTAVASESSAYRARRAAVEAAERARAAATRSRPTKPADPR